MTITYTAEVATCHKFGCFLKLLFRWRGSIYKLVWADLIVFLFTYLLLNVVYRFALDAKGKHYFEAIVSYCANNATLIPLSLVLGFYVSIVMTRWWDQYNSLPWPDAVAVYVSAYVHGLDERGRVMRRTVMRYLCLCLTMVLTMISPSVKKRFPTMQYLLEAGLLLESEKLIMEDMDQAFPKHPKHWMPIVWAASIITRARKEGRIRDDFAVKTIIDELNAFRHSANVLMYYDNISIPLVYTQVVTLAVYTYFLSSLMGQQWTEAHDRKFDGPMFFPVFTLLQFFFYMGWLKVAEVLINPWGDDDEDFEVNWLIDRNLQVSYLIVDEMHLEHPELVKDQYWDEVFPNELPYANEGDIREEPPEPSTGRLNASKPADTSLEPFGSIESVLSRQQGFRRFRIRKDARRLPSIASSHLEQGTNTPVFEMEIEEQNLDEEDDEDDEVLEGEKEEDEFEKLKEERIRERLERQQIKYQAIVKNSRRLEPDAPFEPDVAQWNELPADLPEDEHVSVYSLHTTDTAMEETLQLHSSIRDVFSAPEFDLNDSRRSSGSVTRAAPVPRYDDDGDNDDEVHDAEDHFEDELHDAESHIDEDQEKQNKHHKK